MGIAKKITRSAVFIFGIFFFAGILRPAFAADEPAVIITGNTTWTGDKSFTGTLNGSNIGIEVNNSSVDATVTTDGNITTHTNGWRGISSTNGGKITIENTTSGKTFSSVNNGEAGIFSNGNGSSVTIKDMNVVVEGNGERGVLIENGGQVNLEGDGTNTLDITDSTSSSGIYATGGNSTLNITGMDVTISDNGQYGLFSDNGSTVNITGTKAGGNSLNISGNHVSSSSSYGIYSNGNNSNVSLENMNISISDHNTGFQANSQAAVSVSSTSGQNTLDISNSTDTGLSVSDRAVVDIDNMSTTIKQNGNYGIKATGGGHLNFTNSTNGNFLKISDNGSDGILAIDNNSGESSSVSISDLNVTIENNPSMGAMARYGGKVSFSSTSGLNTLEIINNNGLGIGLASYDDSNGVASSIEVKNMNTTISDHNTGIQAHNKATVSVSSASGANTLNVSNNSDTGLLATDGGAINIDNTSTTLEQNGNYGIKVENGGQLNFTNTTADNFLKISGNGSDGILVTGNNSGTSSSASVSGLNVIIENNSSVGAMARYGAKLEFTGITSGTNTLDIINNNGLGIGLASYDDGNGVASSIEVKNMNTTISDHNTGIQAHNKAKVSFSSASGYNTINILDNTGTGMLLTDGGIIDIDNMTTSIKQSGSYGINVLNGSRLTLTNRTASRFLFVGDNASEGIYVKDNNSGVPSSVSVSDFDVLIDNNGTYGIRAESAGKVSFSSASGSNLFFAVNNKNAASNWSGGAGMIAQGESSGEFSEIKIENMEIYVEDNGQYGIVAENGGSVKIVGNGSNNILVSGNKVADTSAAFLGAGLLADGLNGSVSSTIDIAGSNISVSDNGKTGIFANAGGTININGNDNTLIVSDNVNNVGNPWDYGNGISAQGSGSNINIGGMNIDVKDNGAYGISAEDGSKITISGNGSNTLNLTGNQLYGMFLKGVGSEMDINGMVISGSAASHALIGLEVDGTYKFTDSVISTSAGTLFHAYGDDGKYVLNNSTAVSTNGQLFTLDSNNAVVEATGSNLTGGIYTASTKTSTVTMTGSAWNMKDSSNITNLTLSGSTVNMGKDAGFNTLTLSKLVSDNSNYSLNTYFDVTGTLTDKIIVDGGDATGTGNMLHITSAGYDGSYQTNGYGIQIVNLDNATNKSIDFSLLGGVVDSGAYEYELYRAADLNYYLQGTHHATSTAKTVANMPAVHISIVKTGLNEMRKRFGELRSEGFDNKYGIWARTYAKHLRVDETINSKMNLYGVEAGYDRAFYNDDDSKFIAGLMAGYLYTDKIRHHNGSRFSGDSTAQTPSIGLYGTWFNKNGWFADVTTRYFFSKMEVDSYTAAGDLIDYDADRNFLTASVEVGKQFEYQLDSKKKFVFEPKIEAQFLHAGSESFTTNTGNSIDYSKTQAINTRAAVKLGYNYKTSKDIIYEPFVEVGVNHEFDGKTDIKYAGGDFKSDVHGTGFDMALGLHAALSENVGLFGDVTYENGSVYEGVSGQIGIRFSFGDGKKAAKTKETPAEQSAPAFVEEPAVMQEKKPIASQQSAQKKIATTHYAFDKDDLSPAAKKSLDEVVLKIKDDTSIGVILIGHTDSTGPEKYNQSLSERRAKKAYDYLKASGIEENRLAFVGKGELEPAADNATKTGRAENRRVEIYIF